MGWNYHRKLSGHDLNAPLGAVAIAAGGAALLSFTQVLDGFDLVGSRQRSVVYAEEHLEIARQDALIQPDLNFES